MPGGIATELQRHVGGAEYMKSADERFRQAGSALKTVEQGAATSVLLATSPQLDGRRRSLLRGLQRGTHDSPPWRGRARRRRALRPRPRQCRAALGRLARVARRVAVARHRDSGLPTAWARLDSNQDLTDYESAALTIELRARGAEG